jgi:hypothetical protein
MRKEDLGRNLWALIFNLVLTGQLESQQAEIRTGKNGLSNAFVLGQYRACL